MEFAIKIGEQYLKEIDCDSQKDRYQGHGIFAKATGVKFIGSHEPTFFSSISTKSKVAEVIEAIRWGDIPTVSVQIIPKE